MKHDPLIGKKLANFLVDRVIGRGGMAQIYYGVDTSLERPVAIKVIDARFQGDPEYAKRFVDEAKIVARWKHENIVAVYYADQEDELYYFVMEFIDGAGLDELLENYVTTGELMPHADVLRIGKDMAKALDYAHAHDVVHRDFKPSNVMISRDDRVILADFGLALDINQGSMGQIFGTPHYIAPEQARRSSDAVPQSDIYALGVVLYEMLTGAVPFDDESAMAVAVQHMSEPPPLPTELNPALSQEVEKVLLKALEKEPEDRYQSGAELMAALDEAINTMDAKAAEKPAILPPAAVSGTSQPARKLSQMSISDMLMAELEKEEPPTQQSFRAPRAPKTHEAETKKMRAPKLTKPAKKNRTTEMDKFAEQDTFVGQSSVKPKKSDGNQGQKMLIGIGALVIIGLIIVVGVMMMGGNDDTPIADEVAVETIVEPTSDTANIQATQIQATSDALAIQPTVEIVTTQEEAVNTPVPQITTTDVLVPTNTSIPLSTATNTILPTEDPAPAQTLTSQAGLDALATQNVLAEATLTQSAYIAQTQVAETQAAQVVIEPTIIFPNGRPIEMTYNSAGFYLRNNGTDSNIRMSRLAFRAMNAEGFETGNSFDGVNWARFYNFIDRNGHCVAIEINDQPSWTRPNTCLPSAGNAFNSLLTFMPNDQQIFWDGRNGATQFAIYWDDAEIARCSIADGFCQIRVGE